MNLDLNSKGNTNSKKIIHSTVQQNTKAIQNFQNFLAIEYI